MKKKVCIIHKVQTLDPRSFYKQGRSLLKAGYETTIVGLYEKDEVIQGIRLIGFKSPKRRLARFFITNYHIFRKVLKEKADIYHFHDLDFIPWAVLLKILTRSKIIYDIHEAYPEYILIKPYIPKCLRKVISKLVYILEHVSSRFFDAIITNDNFVLQDFYHDQKEVIYNFPLLDFFENGNNSLPYQGREYDIIFIGSLPAWHFTPMLDTARILNKRGCHAKWLLLPSKTSHREWMLAQINDRNLSEYFTIPESVPFTSVPNFLYNSRIGIITIPPYKKYLKNIPLKMFEYMGCGLPVIASDLPPIRQFVDGKNCAILVKHDPNAYANAIISLLNNPENAEEMGKNGKQLVVENYNWSTEERKLLSVYKKLLPDAQ